MKRQAVSLVDELQVLCDAVDAVEFLLQLMATSSLPDREAERLTPRRAGAVLSILSARLTLLRKVASGSAPADLLVAGHNARPSRVAAHEDGDVVLRVRRQRKRV